MARTKTFTSAEITDILATMRTGGVASFEYKGLKVQFAPQFTQAPVSGPLDDDPFMVAQRVKSAVEEFNKVNDEAEINLEWSV